VPAAVWPGGRGPVRATTNLGGHPEPAKSTPLSTPLQAAGTLPRRCQWKNTTPRTRLGRGRGCGGLPQGGQTQRGDANRRPAPQPGKITPQARQPPTPPASAAGHAARYRRKRKRNNATGTATP